MIKYEDYQDLIKHRAEDFSRRHGIDLDDLMSEGNMAFLKALDEYEESKGASFKTFLCWKIKGEFTKLLREEFNKPVKVNLDIVDDTASPEAEFLFRDAVSKLSDEAKFVVKTVLETPIEIIQMCREGMTPISQEPYKNYVVTAEWIKKYLRGIGWTWTTIWSSMEEIKTMLKSL